MSYIYNTKAYSPEYHNEKSGDNNVFLNEKLKENMVKRGLIPSSLYSILKKRKKKYAKIQVLTNDSYLEKKRICKEYKRQFMGFTGGDGWKKVSNYSSYQKDSKKGGVISSREKSDNKYAREVNSVEKEVYKEEKEKKKAQMKWHHVIYSTNMYKFGGELVSRMQKPNAYKSLLSCIKGGINGGICIVEVTDPTHPIKFSTAADADCYSVVYVGDCIKEEEKERVIFGEYTGYINNADAVKGRYEYVFDLSFSSHAWRNPKMVFQFDEDEDEESEDEESRPEEAEEEELIYEYEEEERSGGEVDDSFSVDRQKSKKQASAKLRANHLRDKQGQPSRSLGLREALVNKDGITNNNVKENTNKNLKKTHKNKIILPSNKQYVLDSSDACNEMSLVNHFQCISVFSKNQKFFPNCEWQQIVVDGWPHIILTSIPGVQINPGDELYADFGYKWFDRVNEFALKCLREELLFYRLNYSDQKLPPSRHFNDVHNSFDKHSSYYNHKNNKNNVSNNFNNATNINLTNDDLCSICMQPDRCKNDIAICCDGCDKVFHLRCIYTQINPLDYYEWFCPFCVKLAHRVFSINNVYFENIFDGEYMNNLLRGEQKEIKQALSLEKCEKEKIDREEEKTEIENLGEKQKSGITEESEDKRVRGERQIALQLNKKKNLEENVIIEKCSSGKVNCNVNNTLRKVKSSALCDNYSVFNDENVNSNIMNTKHTYDGRAPYKDTQKRTLSEEKEDLQCDDEMTGEYENFNTEISEINYNKYISSDKNSCSDINNVYNIVENKKQEKDHFTEQSEATKINNEGKKNLKEKVSKIEAELSILKDIKETISYGSEVVYNLSHIKLNDLQNSIRNSLFMQKEKNHFFNESNKNRSNTHNLSYNECSITMNVHNSSDDCEDNLNNLKSKNANLNNDMKVYSKKMLYNSLNEHSSLCKNMSVDKCNKINLHSQYAHMGGKLTNHITLPSNVLNRLKVCEKCFKRIGERAHVDVCRLNKCHFEKNYDEPNERMCFVEIASCIYECLADEIKKYRKSDLEKEETIKRLQDNLNKLFTENEEKEKKNAGNNETSIRFFDDSSNNNVTYSENYLYNYMKNSVLVNKDIAPKDAFLSNIQTMVKESVKIHDKANTFIPLLGITLGKTTFEREFSTGVYTATISSYHENTDDCMGSYFYITYEDGDDEWLNTKELLSLLLPQIVHKNICNIYNNNVSNHKKKKNSNVQFTKTSNLKTLVAPHIKNADKYASLLYKLSKDEKERRELFEVKVEARENILEARKKEFQDKKERQEKSDSFKFACEDIPREDKDAEKPKIESNSDKNKPETIKEDKSMFVNDDHHLQIKNSNYKFRNTKASECCAYYDVLFEHHPKFENNFSNYSRSLNNSNIMQNTSNDNFANDLGDTDKFVSSCDLQMNISDISLLKENFSESSVSLKENYNQSENEEKKEIIKSKGEKGEEMNEEKEGKEMRIEGEEKAESRRKIEHYKKQEKIFRENEKKEETNEICSKIKKERKDDSKEDDDDDVKDLGKNENKVKQEKENHFIRTNKKQNFKIVDKTILAFKEKEEIKVKKKKRPNLTNSIKNENKNKIIEGKKSEKDSINENSHSNNFVMTKKRKITDNKET